MHCLKVILRRSGGIRAVSTTASAHSSSEPPKSTPKIDHYRTHFCGKVTRELEGERVMLSGWVQSVRNNNFILLRDLHGHVQVFLDEALLQQSGVQETMKSVRNESVVAVRGVVRRRPAGQANAKMATGAVEVVCESVQLLGAARAHLPFAISGFIRPNEIARLTYRYLDLRFADMQHNLVLRSNFVHKVRQFMSDNHFLDIETPTLFRRTPGGAREFIVPTNKSGQFYCLTQSPQQFKQLLMIGGLDRYYQIARCYRDESTKPDRQPEFTQIDVEMSFVNEEDVMRLIERLLEHCWPHEATRPHTPLQRLTFAEAMSHYGVDKPDLRFDMRLVDLTALFLARRRSGVQRIDALLDADSNFCATAIRIPKQYHSHVSLTLAEIESVYTDVFASTPFPASIASPKQTFTFVAMRNESGTRVHKHVDGELKAAIAASVGVEADDVVLVLASPSRAKNLELFGKVRLALADLIDKKTAAKGDKGPLLRDPALFRFLWVVDFPLFTRNEETGRLESTHHPFTAPRSQDVQRVWERRELDAVLGLHYDLVLNGSEIAGGSIRVHDAGLQRHILAEVLGEDCGQLGHLIEALECGAPPHGGIAIGLDRLVAILCGTTNIRNVIAFPKGPSGRDLMSSAPNVVAQQELDYYKIRCVDGDEEKQ